MTTTSKTIMTEVIVSIYGINETKSGVFCCTLLFDDGTSLNLKPRYIYAAHSTKLLNYTILITESQFLARDSVKAGCTYSQQSQDEQGELYPKQLENLSVKILTNEEWLRLVNGEAI